jgi:L-lactate dehydrogenase complex protein LldG
MTEARAQILTSIRLALGRGVVDAETRQKLRAHLAGHARNLVPARGQVTGRQKIEDFARMVEFSLATIAQVRSVDDVPAAVAEYLKQQNLPAEIRMAPDRRLDAIPWGRAPLLKIARGKPDPKDEVGLSGAFAGIAETGTLMLVSGPETPSTLNFLPETHVVVVRASELVGGYEDAWAKLRTAMQAMPRTVNFVTGPSRSGDIEQTLQLGAHGPRRLHVVLVDDEPEAGPA